MAIKPYIDEAVRKIELDREREANIVRERVMREKILPFNAEIDKARDEAIAQKQSALNFTIASQQEAFAKEKQAIIEAAEKKKNDNSANVIGAEIAVAIAVYDKHIAKLKAQSDEIKE